MYYLFLKRLDLGDRNKHKRCELMDKKLQKGIFAVLLANIINVIFSLATNFLLPKYLSVESYAAIKEFQLYVSYVGLFHFGFVDGIYLKYGGKDLNKKLDSNFSTNISTMRIFQIFITLAVVGVAINLNDKILLLFALSILPQNMANYFKFLYQAIGEFDLYGKAMNLTTITTFLLNIVLLFVIKTDKMLLYIGGYVILFFIIWFVLEVYFRKKHILIKGKIFSIKELIDNIRTGCLLTLGNLSSIFLSSMDRWFVKVLMNTIAFAQYSFAVSVENFLNLAITPVTTTLFNYFCRETDVKVHRKVFNYVVVFATLIPAAAFPVKFILEVFLKKYLDSVAVVFLLFSAQMFYTIIKSIYINLYKVQRKQKKYFVKLLCILVIGFVFNVICYRINHVKEAFAVGTLFSAIIWFFLSKRDFKYLKTEIKTEIYIFFELVMFLFLGINVESILGFLMYIIGTIVMLAVLMRETFLDLLSKIIENINKLK